MYRVKRVILGNNLPLCFVITDSYMSIISSSVVDNGCFAVRLKNNS
jgi:hypothetical protein